MNWILITLLVSFIICVVSSFVGAHTDNHDLMELTAGGFMISLVVFIVMFGASWFPMIDHGQVDKELATKVIKTKTKIILESDSFPSQETTDFRAIEEQAFITKIKFTNAWGGCETFQYRIEYD